MEENTGPDMDVLLEAFAASILYPENTDQRSAKEGIYNNVTARS